MANIVVSPEQLSQVGGQFAQQRQQLEALIQQANSLVQSLEGTYKGNRAARFFSEYASMKPNLTAAMQTLQQTSDLLKRASADFSAVDNA